MDLAIASATAFRLHLLIIIRQVDRRHHGTLDLFKTVSWGLMAGSSVYTLSGDSADMPEVTYLFGTRFTSAGFALVTFAVANPGMTLGTNGIPYVFLFLTGMCVVLLALAQPLGHICDSWSKTSLFLDSLPILEDIRYAIGPPSRLRNYPSTASATSQLTFSDLKPGPGPNWDAKIAVFFPDIALDWKHTRRDYSYGPFSWKDNGDMREARAYRVMASTMSSASVISNETSEVREN
ncbi:hypothetical protein SPI_08612 [Niveomyces insectorum RCEF 264]|uniref:Uncharacterized protein n=1 Tax=Niveomyces insectorum RCEF 264 TaxID=1081102 RepID=A0A167MTM6_9HYPO|nr:hypothetical protein SPI_08612 [Niveomyces insectorum RCEF 264]